MPTTADGLSPMFKWTGGKRRELAMFAPHYPEFVTSGRDWSFVEPFVGAGAVFWSLRNPRSVINDWDGELVNFYRMAAVQHPLFLARVHDVAQMFVDGDRDTYARAYYDLRDLDRGGALLTHPDWLRAARFFVVNQLAFSGMRRFNAAGEFNIPFGHYKSFNDKVLSSAPHAGLLATTDIRCGDYRQVLLDTDAPNTFAFLDPPYTRVMKTYSADNVFGDDKQLELRDTLAGLRHTHWMVVIDRSELTERLYADYIVDDYPVSYGVNIKNRFSQQARHIVACNYTTPAGGVPAAKSAHPGS